MWLLTRIWLCGTALVLTSVICLSMTASYYPFTISTVATSAVLSSATDSKVNVLNASENIKMNKTQPHHIEHSVRSNATHILNRRNNKPKANISTRKPTAVHPSRGSNTGSLKLKSSSKNKPKTKIDPIVGTSASSGSRDSSFVSSSGNTSGSNNIDNGNFVTDTKQGKPSTNSKEIIITICVVVIGGLVVCILCLLNTLGFHCIRSRKRSPQGVIQSVSFSGKTIGSPTPLLDSLNDRKRIQQQSQQQPQQLSEFWNISDDMAKTKSTPTALHITSPLDCLSS